MREKRYATYKKTSKLTIERKTISTTLRITNSQR